MCVKFVYFNSLLAATFTTSYHLLITFSNSLCPRTESKPFDTLIVSLKVNLKKSKRMTKTNEIEVIFTYIP